MPVKYASSGRAKKSVEMEGQGRMTGITEYVVPPGTSSLRAVKSVNQGNQFLGRLKALCRKEACQMGLDRGRNFFRPRRSVVRQYCLLICLNVGAFHLLWDLFPIDSQE
jgi:hypothetical protein